MNDDVTITSDCCCQGCLLFFSTSSTIQGSRTTDFFFTLAFSFPSSSFSLSLSTSVHRHISHYSNIDEDRGRIVSASDDNHKKTMQQHQQYGEGQRSGLLISGNKARYDDFYTKLERIRLTAAASSSSKFSQNNRKFFFVSSTETSYMYKEDDND